MFSAKRGLLLVGVGLLLGVVLSTASNVFAGRDELPGQEPLPLEALRVFTEVLTKIKSDYVEPVDDKTLLENAIKGMLSGLDPHSSYLDGDAYDDLKADTSGEFGGLGIEVDMEDGVIKVVSPIDDTPAQRAGIKSGDLIVRLDDKPVKGLSLSDAIKVMRGKPGTDLKLTVVRGKSEPPLIFTITRAVIKVKSVKSRMLEAGYGYVRISQFKTHSADNMLRALDTLKEAAEGGLKGLVLDLRNNPGGVLNGAVAVSDAFLEKGLIVYTEGRISNAEMKFNATPTDVLKGTPLVVLVNGGSASASEIVAGALQDHRRAIIMGSRTFGKGSVQTILPIDEVAALKLTTARYYTPSGRSIQAEGIVPDVILENFTLTEQRQVGIKPITEADLAGHLHGVDEGKRSRGKDGGEEDEKLAKTDYQLYEALNLLKGLNVLNRQTKGSN
ncbi:MAG: S41 family peptidase [Gammaproteobacteria bacterium]|nr:S41 family peptidase [Gammaproteobacteria bacterium]